MAEAAEAALDSDITKPLSAHTLCGGLQEARQRKRVLENIFLALNVRAQGLAAPRCLNRFAQRQQYRRCAARTAA